MELYEREYSSPKDEDSLKQWAEQRKSLEGIYTVVQMSRALGRWPEVLFFLRSAYSGERTADLQEVWEWALHQARQYFAYMTTYILATQGDIDKAKVMWSMVDGDWPDPQRIQPWIEEQISRNKHFADIYSSFAAFKSAYPKEIWLETMQDEVMLHQKQHLSCKLSTEPPIKDVTAEEALLDIDTKIGFSQSFIVDLLEQLKNLRVAHGIHDF